MVHMGKVYRALRWSIAMSLFEDALELADAIDFPQAKMMALCEIGEMKCHWGQFEESLELFKKAFDLLEEGDLKSRRIILLDMVIAHEGLDDMARCRELLEEVLEIDKTIGCEEVEEDRAHYRRLTMNNDRDSR
jgi:tetratricopeptide (TPR) repeat protein